MMIIAISGLRPLSFWTKLEFWRHARASMAAARVARGNLYAASFKAGGYRYFLSAWANQDDMKIYAKAEPHLSAMQAYERIAIGKLYITESDHIPTWDEAVLMLEKWGE
jgi:hypothetical protein